MATNTKKSRSVLPRNRVGLTRSLLSFRTICLSNQWIILRKEYIRFEILKNCLMVDNMRASILFILILVFVTVVWPTVCYFAWGKKEWTDCMRDYVLSNSSQEAIWELGDWRLHIWGDYVGSLPMRGWSNGLLMTIPWRPIASLYNTNYAIIVYVLVKLGY